MREYRLCVDEDYSGGERLDEYAARCIHLSRSRLKKAKITVDAKIAKMAHKVKANQVITIELSPPPAQHAVAEDIPLDVVYEDEDVLVINKPQGLVVHPASGNWEHTLVSALLFRYGKDFSGGDDMRPGIVHRLDKDTSGLMIISRNEEAKTFLSYQFLSRSVTKEYIALAKGEPKALSGTIDTVILRDSRNRKRFCALPLLSSTKGKRATTKYKVIGIYTAKEKKYTLFRLSLLTGRTHQIRVHLKSIGCPILGDAIYSREDPLFPDATLMLHSALLEVTLPSGKRERFTSDMPKRFQDTLGKMECIYEA